jgi:cytochrome c oxidase cbb3-type subunit 2
MENPQAVVAASNMPSYAHLNVPLDTTWSERKMKLLGFPYTQADLDELKGKTEMDAIIAYMRKLGADIPVAAKTVAAASGQNPYRGLKAVEAEARSIYARECAACHGEKMEGSVGPELQGTHDGEAELFAVIANGRTDNGMPAFGTTLGEQQIWKLVTLIGQGRK